MSADPLAMRLADGDLVLTPLAEAHREPLRTACAADPDIWDIYPISFAGNHFDANFAMLLGAPARVMLAVFVGGELAGMSGYLNIAAQHRRLEIGSTYLAPVLRGTGANDRMKALMIGHAFACGFDRIEFRVDMRNARSLAAVAKLGAMREGVLRRHMVTWTGHVRDSAIFSILRAEWSNHRAGSRVSRA